MEARKAFRGFATVLDAMVVACIDSGRAENKDGRAVRDVAWTGQGPDQH